MNLRIIQLLVVVTLLGIDAIDVELECSGRSTTVCSNHELSITEKDSFITLKHRKPYTELFLKNAYVKFLPKELYSVLPSMTTLKVVNSSLQEIEKTDFEQLDRLTVLDLSSNDISALAADVFEALTNLQKLNLDSNKISFIPSQLFSKNLKLTEISIGSNEISRINDETFKKLRKLVSINLRFNKIEELYSETFDDCSELKTLVIANNNLKYIAEDIFEKNTKMTFSWSRFGNNACLDNYKQSDISTMDDLKEAFSENCKSPCYKIVDKLRKSSKKLEEELQETKQKLNEKSEKYEKLKSKLKEVEKSLEVKDEETEKIEEEKDQLQKKFDQYRSRAESKEKDLTKEIEDFEEKVKSLKISNEELLKNQVESQTSADECQKSLQAAKIAQDILGLEFSNCVHKYNLTELKLNQDIERLKGFELENSKLRAELDGKNYKILENEKKFKETSQKLETTEFIFNELFKKHQALNLTSFKLAANRCGVDLKELCNCGPNSNSIYKDSNDFSSIYRESSQDTETVYKSQDTISSFAIQDTNKNFKNSRDTNYNSRNSRDTISTQDANHNSKNNYNIDCIIQDKSYTTGSTRLGTFTTCSIANRKHLDCSYRLNSITDQSYSSIDGFSFTDTYLTDSPFPLMKKYRNLKFLEISKSGFGHFDENLCGLSANLVYVTIVTSTIGTRVNLDDCEALRELKIENSGIVEISAAYPIPSLTNLVLRKNKIEKIGRNFFEKFENLKNVQMSGNRIGYLSGDTFNGNRELEICNMADNPIKVIEGKILARNLKLTHANFNNLECISNASGYGRAEIARLTEKLMGRCSQ